jgi:hypothetical protein
MYTAMESAKEFQKREEEKLYPLKDRSLSQILTPAIDNRAGLHPNSQVQDQIRNQGQVSGPKQGGAKGQHPMNVYQHINQPQVVNFTQNSYFPSPYN